LIGIVRLFPSHENFLKKVLRDPKDRANLKVSWGDKSVLGGTAGRRNNRCGGLQLLWGLRIG
jgi:hypothetical protein